jgi:capsular polysaccharide transport system permease protein
MSDGSLDSLLQRVGGAVRSDRADAARALLAEATLANGTVPFAVFVARVLLGEPIGSSVTERSGLAPLFADGAELDGERVADIALLIAEASDVEAPRIELGCILMQVGEAHWAEQVLLPVYSEGASPLLRRVLSGIWAMLGRSDSALQGARSATERGPEVAEYHVHYSALLLNGSEPGLALLAAGRAIGLDPGNAIAWRITSSAYLALGLTAEAIEASRRAASLSEDQAGFAEEVLVSAAAEGLNRTQAALAPSPPPAPTAARGAPWGARPGWAELRPFPAVAPGRLRDLLRAKLRLLDALMLRELRGLFTHSRLGYAWALFEPLTHVFVLTVAMIFLAGPNSRPVIGDSMAEFYMTGVLPYLLFCHLTEQGLHLARSQRVVLTLPGIQLGDVLVASLLLRAATDAIVILISITVFVAIGLGSFPHDPLNFLLAFLVVFLLGFGVASINLALSMMGSVPEHLWPILLRAAYFLSGIFYHPSAMPAALRDVVLWNPLIHVLEWVRQAYYPAYTSPFLDIEYLMRSTVVALLLGTLAAASVSRRVRLHG